MTEKTICGRFAPSPSGRLHLGNLLSSLLAWLDVRSLGGRLLFRLEDLDPERSFGHYARLMAEDLKWLGLDWDEGWTPECPGDYAQGGRTAVYESLYRQLTEQGLVYPCYCSRAQRLAASAPHPGQLLDEGCACRRLTDGERALLEKKGRKPARKLRVDACVLEFTDGHYGPQRAALRPGADDFIIRRADGVFAYQLAVSCDDAHMGVTRVVRARDLLPSTPRQIWLIRKLGYPPPDYCHAPLLVAPDGRKLSKRDGDLNMETLRQAYSPRELCGKLAFLAGLQPEPAPVEAADLIPGFAWTKVPKEDILLQEGLFT